MAPDQAFVFLLNSPVSVLPQLDRLEQKLDKLIDMLGQLLRALNDDEAEPELTLDGDHVFGGQRDTSKGLG